MMNVASVRTVLREKLKNEGLQRIPAIKVYEVWGWPKKNVTPYYAPAVIRKSFGIEILGVVGVYVRGFEDVWVSRLKKHYPGEKRVGFLFGRYITNFKEFLDPAVVRQPQDVEEHVRMILNLLSNFPNDIDNLISDLAQGRVGSSEAKDFLGHWVKWRAFLLWLRESSYDYPSTLDELHKIRRIDPYDAIYQELIK